MADAWNEFASSVGNPAATLQAAQASAEAARAAILTPAYYAYYNAIASADLAWVNELASPWIAYAGATISNASTATSSLIPLAVAYSNSVIDNDGTYSAAVIPAAVARENAYVDNSSAWVSAVIPASLTASNASIDVEYSTIPSDLAAISGVLAEINGNAVTLQEGYNAAFLDEVADVIAAASALASGSTPPPSETPSIQAASSIGGSIWGAATAPFRWLGNWWNSGNDELVPMPAPADPGTPPLPEELLINPHAGRRALAVGGMQTAAFKGATSADMVPFAQAFGHGAEIIVAGQPSPGVSGGSVAGKLDDVAGKAGAAKSSIHTGGWAQGSFGSAAESLEWHFVKHGADVGAKDLDQYLRKASEFAKALKGATKSPVQGATSGVTRYKKLGKFVDLDKDGNIISFGLQ